MFNFERNSGLPAATLNMAGKQENKEDTYFRVMRLLQDNPQMSQRELARSLGISLGGVNYCMKALINKGWIKIQNFSLSNNKFGYVYVLTPGGIARKAELAGRFLKRKMEEYEALSAEIKSLHKEADAQDTNSLNH